MSASDTPPASPPAPAAGYDPSVFQPPHPDDRAGSNTATPAKPAKGKGTTTKGKPDGTHVCFHCGTAGAAAACGGCKLAYYCGPACQKRDWKQVGSWGDGGIDGNMLTYHLTAQDNVPSGCQGGETAEGAEGGMGCRSDGC